MSSRINFEEFKRFLSTDPQLKTGCLVDTSILFAVSYDLDSKNDIAVKIFEELAKQKIPVYTNVNIRAEFLNNYLKILIPECIVDIHRDWASQMPELLASKLKSIRTTYIKKLEEKKTYKIADDEKERVIKLFSSFGKDGDNRDGWQIFCEDYLKGKIEKIWDKAVDELGLNFIAIRDNEAHPLLTEKVSWKGVYEIMGSFGIGSFDAMIVNLFLKSRLPLLITADEQMAYTVAKTSKDKLVLIP
jgi:predicted nucleic acid-binding protein